MGAPAMLTNRDCSLIGRLRFEPDGSLLVHSQSVVDPTRPERTGFVRMDFKNGGYIIRPRGEGVFSVTFMICVDPCGWIPNWVKNLVAWKQALVLAKFKNVYKV